jgi:hypothetical protein
MVRRSDTRLCDGLELPRLVLYDEMDGDTLMSLLFSPTIL